MCSPRRNWVWRYSTGDDYCLIIGGGAAFSGLGLGQKGSCGGLGLENNTGDGCAAVEGDREALCLGCSEQKWGSSLG